MLPEELALCWCKPLKWHTCLLSLSITSDLVLVTNKRIGEDSKPHKMLSRVRNILYGISVPLLFLMFMSRYTVASAAMVKSVGCITFGVVLHEFLDWGHGLIWLPLLLSLFVPRVQFLKDRKV